MLNKDFRTNIFKTQTGAVQFVLTLQSVV